MFESVERAAGRRAPHYGSALELKYGSTAPAGDRRSASSMARSRYESLDSLRAAGAEPAGSLLDEYRAYRAAVRPVESRRESFSGRGDSRRQGLARHDSLRT
ncbi:uncharacterized protein LOC119089372 [Pollicipes pollicipes]|uniref:uncharacterized protein LOC119089372 n=1 Tax=Pollicipes pollicipes TaxID=41117 RepID=UPI0018858884|nr:uncharacterized protein LOC119089372 [Pollicipes pollicipes]